MSFYGKSIKHLYRARMWAIEPLVANTQAASILYEYNVLILQEGRENNGRNLSMWCSSKCFCQKGQC